MMVPRDSRIAADGLAKPEPVVGEFQNFG